MVVAPPVVANGAPGAFTMSPPASEDKGGEGGEGGEGSGTSNADILCDGETEADNVVAAAEGEARLAAAGAAAAPAAAAGP